MTAGLHDRFRDAADLLAGALAEPRRRDPGRRDRRRVLPRRLHGERGGPDQARGQRPARRARRRAAQRLHPRRRRRPAARACSSTSIARWRSPGARPPPARSTTWRPASRCAAVEAAVLAARGEDTRADRRGRSTPRRSRWRARSRSATAGPTTHDRARAVARAARSPARAPAAWSAPSADRAARRRRSRRATAAHGRPASSVGGHVHGDLARDPAELRAAALGGARRSHWGRARCRGRGAAVSGRPGATASSSASACGVVARRPGDVDHDQPGRHDLGRVAREVAARLADRRAGSRRPTPRRRRAGTSSAPRRPRRRPRDPCPSA